MAMSTLRGRSVVPATSSSSPDRSHRQHPAPASVPDDSPKAVRRDARAGCIDRLRRGFQWSLLSFRNKLLLSLLSTLVLVLSAVAVLDSAFYQYGSSDIALRIQESEFAVVINTYRRPQMLSQAVRHYAQRCGKRSGVGQVFVVWADQEEAPPDPNSFWVRTGSTRDNEHVSNRAPVMMLRVPNSLNSRFLPIPDMHGSALFMVDDDVQVDCASLAQGFLAWRAYPDSMVGYYPRLATPPRGTSATEHGYLEHCWPIVYLTQRVNFVLTKASFLDRRYLDMYSSSETHPPEIKEYVDRYMNCEDIAMSLLVANVTRMEQAHSTGMPAMPVYVEGSVYDQGLFNGISTGSGFVERRAKCLTDLSQMYRQQWGQSPLDVTYSLRQVSWARHVPGFWWQYRPSNPFEWGALLDFFR